MTRLTHIQKKDGCLQPFDSQSITVSVAYALLEVHNRSHYPPVPRDYMFVPEHIQEAALIIADKVALQVNKQHDPVITVDRLHDLTEATMLEAGMGDGARAYARYRQERSETRRLLLESSPKTVTRTDGVLEPFNVKAIEKQLSNVMVGLSSINPDQVYTQACKFFREGITTLEITLGLATSASQFISEDREYDLLAGRLSLDAQAHEAFKYLSDAGFMTAKKAEEALVNGGYPVPYRGFGLLRAGISAGIDQGLLNPELLNEEKFDYRVLENALLTEGDALLTYQGVITLYKRYVAKSHTNKRYELPQTFFMRVAMGLALNESNPTRAAIQFYRGYALQRYMSSTPTLFNAGTTHSQLASCFLMDVGDDLRQIFGAYRDHAMLSKFAGGIGTSWSKVRGSGALIKGTNGESQGVVPWLKIDEEITNSVNQCFAPSTLIHTSQGSVEIKDITEQHLVLTEDGEFSKVEQVLEYPQKDAPMLALRLKHSSAPTLVTDGHPLFSITGVPLGQARVTTHQQLLRRVITAGWKEVKELSVGDYVGIPIPRRIIDGGLTEEKAFLYGVMLGNGHICKDKNEAGINCNTETGKDVLTEVREILRTEGIHCWENELHGSCTQIKWAHDPIKLGFDRDALYDTNDEKRIHHSFMHLRPSATVKLIEGLLKTDGNISRGKEVTFSTSSRSLGEGLRYQLLRLGVPTHAYLRERELSHIGTRRDGTTFQMEGTSFEMKVSVPMIKELAVVMGVPELTKFNWLLWNDMVFTRIKSIESIEPVEKVYDLIVEGPSSYCTVDMLVHNGGKRKGACAAYMEPWHIDYPYYLQMKYTQGKSELFIEQMNTAAWIPDLFMKRVKTKEPWTLFSPNMTPDLPDSYGKTFDKKYLAYEKKAEDSPHWEAREFKFNNSMQVSMRVSTTENPMHPCAQISDTSELFKVHISYLFSSGHPWITFKDAANIRSPQDHVGVVHSSNLCTEILLNTKPTTYTSSDRSEVATLGEVAVCNLLSVNLVNMLIRDKSGMAVGIDLPRLQESVSTGVRMLDNVIDLSYYPIEEAENANMKHRPIGLGIMGWHHMLQELMIPYDSEEAVEMADHLQEQILYAALYSGVELAKERGAYSTFEGSKWQRGILPQDTPALLAASRGKQFCKFHTGGVISDEDWDKLRYEIKEHGLRNSTYLAIAPTATIGKIAGGASQGVDPVRANVFIETDMEKEFTRINPPLVAVLKRRGIWNRDTARVLRDKITTNYGSVSGIPEIPEDIQRVYKHALELSAFWTVKQNARRQKWIDQAISSNIYMPLKSDLYGGMKVGTVALDLFTAAWEEGMKTTYYFKTESGSRRESTTVDLSREQIRGQISSSTTEEPPEEIKACLLDDPTCEACQ